MSINYIVGMNVSDAFDQKNNQVVYAVGKLYYYPDLDKIYKKGLEYTEANGIFAYSDGSTDTGEEIVELTIGQKFGGKMETKDLKFRTKKLEIVLI